MDEPWTTASHPPGPEFDKARRVTEQQRIARLGPEKRHGFKQLKQDQQRQFKELEGSQRQRWRGQMAERMRKTLVQDKAPHLRPDSHRHQLKDSPDLSHAINDFLDGRTKRVAQAYRSKIGHAYRLARSEVAREQGRERGQMRKAHTGERDAFLTRAERSENLREQFRDNARDTTARGPTPAFEKAAHDPAARRRAFNRAAAKESAQRRDLDRDKRHDHDKPR